MQTPNGSTIQSFDSFASLLSNHAFGAQLRAAGQTQDIAVVHESQQAPAASSIDVTSPRASGPKV